LKLLDGGGIYKNMKMNDEKYSFDEIMEKDGLYYDKIHEEKIFKQTDCIICMEPFY
jgi:hypothetical protein